MRSSASHRSGSSRGFSLIELLVVISIISLIIGITLPALAGARARAREIQALANIRSTGQIFAQYTGENGESYPFVSPLSEEYFPGDGRIVQFEWYPSGTFVGVSDMFALSWAWPSLISSIAPWEETYETWISPGREIRLPLSHDERQASGEDFLEIEEDFSWRMSNAFLADPALFKEGAERDFDLLRATRESEVAFPSSKVLLFDSHVAYVTKRPELVDGHWDLPAAMAFVDGHGSVENPISANDHAGNPLLERNDPAKVYDTADGVRGRDF